MHINPNIEKPIFIQIAEQLEDSIFTKVFPEETKIPSTNELSSLLNINPHTVLKGMNLLVDEEIIYKKRGLGMFVKKGAVNKILLKRQSQFYEQYVAARDQYFLDVCRLVSVLWTACAETSRSACVDIVRKIYRHIERRRILCGKSVLYKCKSGGGYTSKSKW